MRKKILIIGLLFAVLISVGVLSSQLTPIQNIITNSFQVTPSIKLEQDEVCKTTFYEDKIQIDEDCIHYHNFTNCRNTTGPNTDCIAERNVINQRCRSWKETVYRNKTTCTPNDEFVITIDDGKAELKKKLDFSEWGPCIYEEENDCLIVTCVSLYDGAHKGQFTNCNGGRSCQKFEICEGSVKSYYKNSRKDFVEYDETFYLPKMELVEVKS